MVSNEAEKKEPNSTLSEDESPLERNLWPLRTIPRGEVKAGPHGYFDGPKGSIYIQRNHSVQIEPGNVRFISKKVQEYFNYPVITIWVENHFDDGSIRISWKPDRSSRGV